MSDKMSDERREVARRLREYPVHLALSMEGGSLVRALAMLSGLLNVTGLRQDDPAWLYRRLADLIDPTCHVSVCGHPDKHHVCRTCDKCSFGWYEDVHEERFRFCPNCGRRFVGGGGEDA